MLTYLEQRFQSFLKYLNSSSYFGGYRPVLWGMLALSVVPFFGAALAWFIGSQIKRKLLYRLFAMGFLIAALFALASLPTGEVVSSGMDTTAHRRNITVLYDNTLTNFWLIAIYAVNYLLIFLQRDKIVNEPVFEDWQADMLETMEAKARAEVQKARQKIARTPLNEIIKEQEQIVSYSDIYGVQSTILNINSATQGQLEALPRVGKTLALVILHNRQQFGEFASLDDLCRRCTVKPHIRVAIEPLICFNAVSEVVEYAGQKKRGRVID